MTFRITPLLRALAILFAVLTLAALLTLSQQRTSEVSASAATTGAGYSGITPYGGYLGNYIAPDGYRVYCMDSTWDWPSGATGGGTLTTSLETAAGAPVHGSYIEKMNYVLTTFGQTSDPTQAAAVSAFIYAYTSTRATNNGAGYAAGAHYIDGNAVVLSIYDVIWADAEANYAGAPQTARVTITMANSFDGYVDVKAPTGAKGTLTLDGATVAGAQSSTAPLSGNTRVPIVGTPPGDGPEYSITATAEFAGVAGANQDVTIYYTGSQQRTLRGGTSKPVTFSADDSVTLSIEFSPIVQTTVASRFVDEGDAFVDGVTASALEGVWPTRVPVSATGTLYGPFTEQPDVASEAPEDAPVVGTETLTLEGPGDYTTSGVLNAPITGFYTWVWRISAADQADATRALIPDNYEFADEFGLVAETHVVPVDLSAVSQVSVSEVGLGGTIGDQLTVALESGSWLTVDGVPLEAVFEGTAYFVAGDTAPVVSDTVPIEAVVIGTSTIAAPGPGVYSSTTVTAPSATAGFVTWVWRLSPVSELASYFQPWVDQFGLPAETTRVLTPAVVTKAVPAVAIGDPVFDTAIVSGTLPAQPSSLVFQAYLQAADETATCDESTLVFDSHDDPIEVTAVGNYDSPVTTFTNYGTHFWVESLYASDGTLIHRGACGLPDETTLVAPGTIVTKAVTSVELGDPSHDTAVVEGLIPQGATLVFDAYRQQGTDGPLCTTANRVFHSQPVAVNGAGEYDSPATVFTETGTYFWVETLFDRDGEPLHRGDCGAAGEVTTAVPPALATTGVSTVQPAIVGIGMVALGGFVLVVLLVRRRVRS